MSNHRKRVDVPEEIAKGAGDKPAWIEFNTRVLNKHRSALIEIATKAALVTGVDLTNQSDEYQDNALLLISQFDKALDNRFAAYAAFVADWNWQGDNGLPLPKPDNGPLFKNELYEHQTDWIQEQINSLERYRATEGNVSSTMP